MKPKAGNRPYARFLTEHVNFFSILAGALLGIMTMLACHQSTYEVRGQEVSSRWKTYTCEQTGKFVEICVPNGDGFSCTYGESTRACGSLNIPRILRKSLKSNSGD